VKWTPPQPVNPDPIVHMSSEVQETFSCIAYAESRDKLVDTNQQTGAQGLYQIQVWLWQYARQFIPRIPPTPNQATRLQQDIVAAWFWYRNGGFLPEWSSDSQCLS